MNLSKKGVERKKRVWSLAPRIANVEDVRKTQQGRRIIKGHIEAVRLELNFLEHKALNTYTVPPWAGGYTCVPLNLTDNWQERYCCPHFPVRAPSLRPAE